MVFLCYLTLCAKVVPNITIAKYFFLALPRAVSCIMHFVYCDLIVASDSDFKQFVPLSPSPLLGTCEEIVPVRTWSGKSLKSAKQNVKKCKILCSAGYTWQPGLFKSKMYTDDNAGKPPPTRYTSSIMILDGWPDQTQSYWSLYPGPKTTNSWCKRSQQCQVSVFFCVSFEQPPTFWGSRK